jgi:flavodoxin
MKALVVYYTRTGTTAKAAQMIAAALDADKEEIKEPGDRGGPLGWLRSGKEASQRKPAQVKPLQADPAAYDLVVVGTPVWAGTVSSPVRGFIEQYREKLPGVAFFCTMGGDDPVKTFPEMEEACSRSPASTLALQKHTVDGGQAQAKVAEFAEALKAQGS